MFRGDLLSFLLLLAGAGAAPGVLPPAIERSPDAFPAFDRSVIAKADPAWLTEPSALLVHYRTIHRLEPDGTLATTIHEVVRLNRRPALDDFGEYRRIRFDPRRQKLILHALRIHKPDGTTVDSEDRHLQLRDGGTDFQVYGQDKQVVVSFPGLGVGDLLEACWTVRGRNPEYDDRFFLRHTLGDDHLPMLGDELQVIAPAAMPFHCQVLNGTATFDARREGDTIRRTWRIGPRPPLVREEDGPSRETLRLQVVCSTFGTWQEVGAWKEKVRAACWECTPEVRLLTRELVKDCPTTEEKVRVLTQWVRDHIRYRSRGPEGTAYTPHQPGRVLADRFGDCKDQAQLLAVMLREIGLDPWLATLGLHGDGQVLPEVPSPWGTHGILVVRIGKQEHWIDTTARNAPWNWLPAGDRDRAAYLTRHGQVRLVRTPKLTSPDQLIEQSTLVQVRSDGSAQCRRVMVLHKGQAALRRDSWRDQAPSERSRRMAEELYDAFPSCRFRGLRLSEKDLGATDRPLQVQVDFDLPGHFSGERVLEGNFTDSPTWRRLLAYLPGPDRTQPLVLGGPFESYHLYELRLPANLRFANVPAETKVESAWGQFRRRVDPDPKDPRRLQVLLFTRLDRAEVAPADFAAFRRFREQVLREYRVWFALKTTDRAEDIPLLAEQVRAGAGSDPALLKTLAELCLTHGRSRELLRVLTEAGAGDAARLWKGKAHLDLAARHLDAGRLGPARMDFAAALHYAPTLAETNAAHLLKKRLAEVR